MEDVKITSVEKVKDPKRVEAGKRLAAMSKQAKDKKAIDSLSQKMSIDEFQISSINPLAVVGVAGVVGVVVYYKYFSKNKPEAKSETSGASETSEAKTSETKVDPPKEEKQKPKRRELDTLD